MTQLTKSKPTFKLRISIDYPPCFLRLAQRLMLAHMVLCFAGFSLALASQVDEQPINATRLGLIFCLLFLAILGTGYGIWLEFKNSK